MKDDLSLRVGGNVGSNGANQVYIGATYHNLNNLSKEFSLDGQLGQIYNNLQLSGRIDLPTGCRLRIVWLLPYLPSTT